MFGTYFYEHNYILNLFGSYMVRLNLVNGFSNVFFLLL